MNKRRTPKVHAVEKLDSYMEEEKKEIEELAEIPIKDVEVVVEKIKKYKTGMNEPCPCGSGKRYRQCCAIYKKGKRTRANKAR